MPSVQVKPVEGLSAEGIQWSESGVDDGLELDCDPGAALTEYAYGNAFYSIDTGAELSA